ncbi:kinase-like domain-containing protein [Lactarius psammicola]|nr:kinase-like domain-containing protein [Lactarius psammicola]
MIRMEDNTMAASMLGRDDTLGGDAASSVYSDNNWNGLYGRGSLENTTVRARERKPSEMVLVDLPRVVKESEGLLNSNNVVPGNIAATTGVDDQTGRMERINLGKGKWPNDFLDIFQASSRPDTSSLGLGSGPGRVALLRNNMRGSRRYVPRRSSPEACGGSNSGGGDGDSLVPVPFPRTVSGKCGDAPSPSSSNAPSQSQSPSFDPVERTPSNDRDAGSAASASASGNTSSPSSLLPRGRFGSEVDGASSRGRPRFESMIDLGVTSGKQTSASDLMARDATEGSVSRQTLVVREEGKAPTHFQLGNCIGRGQFGAVYRALNLNTGQMVAVKQIWLGSLEEEEIARLMREVDLVKRLSHPSIVKYEGMARDENTLSILLEYAENGSLGQTLEAFGKPSEKLVANYVFKILEGLDYLHRSDVVHSDLKAANILTTKTGNIKLTDFGISLNLRVMERKVKGVAGTPNWMAPEVIELKGASPKSDIWSLGCTVIELLTGRPPYGDIGNAIQVTGLVLRMMFRIVEDECPPIPERFSGPLVGFLKECFHKDPAMRPSAKKLLEHEWLKNHWDLNKDLRPQDSIPFLRRVSSDLQKNGAARPSIPNFKLDSAVQLFDGDVAMLSSSPGRHSFTGSASPVLPEVPHSEADLFEIREHVFVKTTFSKPVKCRVCMEPAKKSVVLCSHCSLIAHSKCSGRTALTCDLRSKLLMHAHFAER